MSSPTGTKYGTVSDGAAVARRSRRWACGGRWRAAGVGSGIQNHGSQATGMPSSSSEGCSSVTEACSRS